MGRESYIKVQRFVKKHWETLYCSWKCGRNENYIDYLFYNCSFGSLINDDLTIDFFREDDTVKAHELPGFYYNPVLSIDYLSDESSDETLNCSTTDDWIPEDKFVEERVIIKPKTQFTYKNLFKYILKRELEKTSYYRGYIMHGVKEVLNLQPYRLHDVTDYSLLCSMCESSDRNSDDVIDTSPYYYRKYTEFTTTHKYFTDK